MDDERRQVFDLIAQRVRWLEEQTELIVAMAARKQISSESSKKLIEGLENLVAKEVEEMVLTLVPPSPKSDREPCTCPCHYGGSCGSPYPCCKAASV